MPLGTTATGSCTLSSLGAAADERRHFLTFSPALHLEMGRWPC